MIGVATLENSLFSPDDKMNEPPITNTRITDSKLLLIATKVSSVEYHESGESFTCACCVSRVLRM